MGSSELLGQQLQEVFESALIQAAPLYGLASKVRMPVEDRGGDTVLYRGSLHEEVRPTSFVTDVLILPASVDSASLIGSAKELGTAAGHVLDGLIRIENFKNHPEKDARNVSNLRVSNIHQLADGRPNLEFGLVEMTVTPNKILFYAFCFAAASINQHYKKS